FPVWDDIELKLSPTENSAMRKPLITIDGQVALVLPAQWLERYQVSEVELIEEGGRLILRPALPQVSFEEAADSLFAEKDALLERLSNA
ncbi:AbrB/MazE/SpoVT family DNA-binding domain-containing protein, partial [Deinococcus wulumuqiensis]